MVTINNKNVAEYLEIVLAKPIKDITQEDLDNIQVLNISGDMNEDETYKIDTSDLPLFKNLKELTLSNGLVTIFNMKDIIRTNIKSLVLNRCAMDDDNTLSVLERIESVSLINCMNDNYAFLRKLNSLKSFSIINPEGETEIDINDIPKGLVFLNIQSGIIDKEEALKDLKSLERLNLLWTNLTDNIINTVNQLPSLKELFITNRHDCSKLREGIRVYHDLSVFAYEKDDDELRVKR